MVQSRSIISSSSVVSGSANFFLVTEISPNLFRGDSYSLFHAPEAVQGRSNIQREDGRTIGLWGSRVVVDDVSHLFARLRSAYDPVMAIEWRF